MKGKWFLGSTLALGLMLLLLVGLSAAQAPAPQQALGTGFTYQGQLYQDGAPVDATCDMTFNLYDQLTLGSQIGPPLMATVPISDGLFTVTLDFGSGIFDGNARWLEIAVRCPAGSGDYSQLVPRQALTPAPYALALPGLWTQQHTMSPNLIGGYADNSVAPGVWGGTIGGGGDITGRNQVMANYGTVGGGFANVASGGEATIAGGSMNTAGGGTAAVGGGNSNQAGGRAATVAGGSGNVANGERASIGGGTTNTASAMYSTVAGGRSNLAGGLAATVAGGVDNMVLGDFAAIGGGTWNRAGGDDATVGGGRDNHASEESATVSGGWWNAAGAPYATVGGGHHITVTGEVATVAGGSWITVTADYAAVGGGQYNAISGEDAAIGGGSVNVASGNWATIGGGSQNSVSGNKSTISGGQFNTAGAALSTIGGGISNTVTADHSTIGGGISNTVTASYSTIGGGFKNTATADHSTIPGGSWAQASLDGQMAYANGKFTSAGDAQASLYVLRNATAGEVTEKLFLDGSGQQLTIAVSRTLTFDMLVTASSDGGQSAGYSIRGVVKNVGGTTTLVGTPSVVLLGADDGTWINHIVVGVDDVNATLVVTVTGVAGATIRWVATVRTAEVSW
jgi:hypothetical protein